MSSRYRDLGSKDSTDSRRRPLLGPRSKTMIEESTTSRYHGNEDSSSPGLGRRYGSARYHRTTVDIPIRTPSSVSSYQASHMAEPSSPHSRYLHSSSGEPSSPRSKYRSSSTTTTSGISSQPFRFTRTASFDTAKSVRNTVYHDFSSHQTNPDKNKKYTLAGRQSPSGGSKTSTYQPKYSSIDVKSKDIKTSSSPPLYHYKDLERLSPHRDASKEEDNSSRSSSISSRGSSGSASRKSSTGSIGRDKITYVGSYSGRTSPEVSTSHDISRISQKIAKTFQGSTRRGSEGSTSPPGSKSPFLRSYSLRGDYTSRYAKHQVERTKVERTKSGPAKTSLQKQSSLPEETEKKEDIVQRSRMDSWLQSQMKSPDSPDKGSISKTQMKSPDSPDKGSISKIFGKQRSDSSSPSGSARKFSFSSKLSSSNESNTDSGGLFKKRFSIPSKYFSSKETMSSGGEGSTEIIDPTGKLKKKYSLPTKLSFRKRSASIEGTGSKSEPASPDRNQDKMRGYLRSTSLDADPEKDIPKESVMSRFKFWDKKERNSPRSRSISPEGRELMSSTPEEVQQEQKAQEKIISTEQESKSDHLVKTSMISNRTKSIERTTTSKSPLEPEKVIPEQSIKTNIEVVSKKIEKQDSTETRSPGDSQGRKLSREERRARYKRGQNTVYSKSMDAAVDLTHVNNENKVDDISAESEMQPSDKLRERRRLRRLERERSFSSISSGKTKSSDSIRLSTQKMKLSVSTEDTGFEKRRSQTIASPAHQDIIESILREQPHLSRDDIRPPSVKEMLKRFVCEDDSSKTVLESRRTKEDGRPHTICGGTLSPDEMRKFEDINFSLARQQSSNESHSVKSDEQIVSSSSDVDGSDLPKSTLGQKNGKIPSEAKVKSSPGSAPAPAASKAEKLIRKFSFKSDDDSEPPHRSLFRSRKLTAEQEEKEKEKKREKELEKEKEKERKVREKEEKERKEREKHKEKERKEKEQKEERARKEKEQKEEKARKEKEEKEDRIRKEKEEKMRKENEKQNLHQADKEILKGDEKEKKEIQHKEKKEKEQNERLKDKERRELDKKEKKERKHKLREEQKEKTQQQLMQAIEKRAEEMRQADEVMSVDGVDNGKEVPTTDKNQEPGEFEFPREGSVSALLTLFSKPEQIEKPRHPMHFLKVRPRTLAAGIAPEIIKTAREMMERRERFHDACKTQDDSSINNRPGSLIDESDRLIEYKPKHTGNPNQDNRLAEKNEEERKKELRKLHKAKKARKTSSTRPFGMMKTKSESNLDRPFELIHVEIDLDDKKETQEPKESKFIELTPVAKQSIPAVKITLDKEADDVEAKRGKTISLDDGLEEFFGDSKKTGEKSTINTSPKVYITTEDLDVISSQTTQHLQSIAGDKKHIKPNRKHASKANPVKTLNQRQDVRTETEAPRTPRIEKKAVVSEHPVIRRKKKKYKDPDNLWRRHTVDLAASAIAGLASTEDFTKVTLRKTGGPEMAKEQDDYRGTKPVMLLHIKGRRNMQTRLIEPCQKSLNSGDCFVLVTKEELFAWVGKDANAIERAKVTEIASRIFTKRALDCKARDITFIEQRDKDPEKLQAAKKFWRVLGADPDGEIRAADCIPVDEEYEKGMTKTNMIYKVHWTEPPGLMPVDSMCGRFPQVSILDTKEVLVFDFGSELYVWNGQQSLSGQRKIAFALGKQLFESPFEPSGIYNPLYPYGKGVHTSTTTNDNNPTPGRPPWALLARLHEKAETILFREKFLDWPDPTKIIKMKGHPSSGELIIKKHIPVELKPCEPKVMLSDQEPLKGETFEGVNVGRGHGVPTRWTGDYYKEGNLCTTIGLTVWHINEYRHYELPQANVGHFHSGEGYVIRWAYYVMTDRIAKDRKSRCRSTITGRVRTAYYFWQGNDCTVNEKGAAAVMAVELDEERGPQVRVVQGKEPPSFLNHFKSTMIIHSGSASKCWFDVDTKTHVSDTMERLSDTSIIRLYCLRNEESSEGYLVQVKATSSSLRSRGCFVLLHCREGQIYVWYGCKATEGSKKNVLVAAKSIKERKPIECNVENEPILTITELQEGNEPDAFFKALGGKKYYCSLIKDPSLQHFTPRLFELSSATGKFLSSEVLCPSRLDGKVCTFPFLQEDLYGVPQPVLFLLDFHYELYIWEGWIPENDIDSLTGTGKQRWDTERKLAMETAMKYADEAGKRISQRVYVVYAGLEPMSFKVAFPGWSDKPYITSIQKETGKQSGARNLATELLNQFTKETYSLEELQQNPPPQGVDPSRLETYLNKEDFSNIFKMNIEEFHKLPGWKQQKIKKAAGLF